MAYSDFSLMDMDMSVCMLDRGRVTLGHYVMFFLFFFADYYRCFLFYLLSLLQYVKQEIFPPFPHAGVSIFLLLLSFCFLTGPTLFSLQLHYYYYHHRPFPEMA